MISYHSKLTSIIKYPILAPKIMFLLFVNSEFRLNTHFHSKSSKQVLSTCICRDIGFYIF